MKIKKRLFVAKLSCEYHHKPQETLFSPNYISSQVWFWVDEDNAQIKFLGLFCIVNTIKNYGVII